MLESSDIIAFSWSTDLARAREFYEHTPGLRCIEQSDFACIFDVNGPMLRLTAVPEVAKPGYTVLGWRAESIEETIQALAGNGVVFTGYDGMDQDVSGAWIASGGDKVTWFTDPDGNNLSVTQIATVLSGCGSGPERVAPPYGAAAVRGNRHHTTGGTSSARVSHSGAGRLSFTPTPSAPRRPQR